MSKNATRNAKIVSDFATGNFTKAALARRYNVDEATIRRVLKAASTKPASVSTTKIKVGDTVKMTERAKQWYGDSKRNPHNGLGKVVDSQYDAVFEYKVNWGNGYENCYQKADLEVVTQVAPEQKDVKASVKAKAKKAVEKQQEVAEGSAETGIRAALQAGQQVAFIITGDSIVLTLGGDTEIVDSTHQNYKAIQLAILDGNFREAYDLMNISKAITKFSKGSITVQNGELYYGEMQLKSSLVNRILDLMAQGDEGFKRLVNFLERLLNNPSRDSVEQLWGFVSHLDVEIDEDGFIIGWKKVQNKNGHLFDSYTGKVPNDVGNVVEMPRFMVNANRDQTCSQGLHVGAWDYVKGFSGDTILKVKVDPADVVSVPSDYNDMKMRAAKYTVLDVVDGNKNLKDFTRAADVKVLHVKVGERGEILSSQEI